ncbi:MAG: hypothetical protein R3B96_05155 [Pirellulaceae bacterium]
MRWGRPLSLSLTLVCSSLMSLVSQAQDIPFSAPGARSPQPAPAQAGPERLVADDPTRSMPTRRRHRTTVKLVRASLLVPCLDGKPAWNR